MLSPKKNPKTDPQRASRGVRFFIRGEQEAVATFNFREHGTDWLQKDGAESIATGWPECHNRSSEIRYSLGGCWQGGSP